jgi:myo-inositol-1(or 4)-monophosphatase
MAMQGDKAAEYLKLAKEAVVDAGRLVEAKKEQGYRVVRKEIKEMVTEIDVEVQAQLINYLDERTGGGSFVSEETRGPGSFPASAWIIDPLDGTHNFIAGLPFYGISIGYIHDGEIMLGAIYFPGSNDLYWAQRGQGAFKNGKKIWVSNNADIAKSIVAYDNQFHLDDRSIKNFISIQERVFTTRILGVATRDACFIAEGTLDARIWNSTKLCDVAAGTLIVEESGGRVTDFKGDKLNFRSVKRVVASSGKFHDELLWIINKGESQ